MHKQDEFSLVTGRFNVCGEVIEFTRQEAIIFYMLSNRGDDGICMGDMVRAVFMDIENKHNKTLSVHLLNMRKKLAHTSCDIIYDKVRNIYRMGKKNG